MKQLGSCLRGWKEIANYFGVAVRTVQIWEKDRGLPVHRVKTGVIAYVHELQEWERKSRKSPKVALFALVISAALLAAALFAWRWAQVSEPMQYMIENGTLNILDDQGRHWLSHPIRNRTLLEDFQVEGGERGDIFLADDFDSDGHREAIIVDFPESPSEESSRVLCLDRYKRLKWAYSFGEQLSMGDRSFAPFYVGRIIGLIKVGTRSFLAAHAWHYLFFPAQVVLLDPDTGELLHVYRHPGRFYSAKLIDLDQDGVQELLLGGVNNPGREGLGHPALSVLKVPFEASPEGSLDLFGKPSVEEWAYWLFPHLDVFAAQSLPQSVSAIGVAGKDQILVQSGQPYGFIYYFDSKLNCVGASPTDPFRALHRQLQHDGKLTHLLSEEEIAFWSQARRFEAAPYGNSPEIKELFEYKP